MGSVITRKRGARTYAYYVYYDNNGQRIEAYCGAKADPESKRKLLQSEMNETKMQIASLNTKLADLQMRIDKVGEGSTSAAPPPRGKSQKTR